LEPKKKKRRKREEGKRKEGVKVREKTKQNEAKRQDEAKRGAFATGVPKVNLRNMKYVHVIHAIIRSMKREIGKDYLSSRSIHNYVARVPELELFSYSKQTEYKIGTFLPYSTPHQNYVDTTTWERRLPRFSNH